MKKLLLGIITVLMIIGLSSDVRAQSDTTSTWKIYSGCFHDSQDEHLRDLDIAEPFMLTINTVSNILTFDDPNEPKEYTATGEVYSRRLNNGIQYQFEGVDEKGVECIISVVLYMTKGSISILVNVVYPTHGLYWIGKFLKEEPKIQASTNI